MLLSTRKGGARLEGEPRRAGVTSGVVHARAGEARVEGPGLGGGKSRGDDGGGTVRRGGQPQGIRKCSVQRRGHWGGEARAGREDLRRRFCVAHYPGSTCDDDSVLLSTRRGEARAWGEP